MRKIFTKRRNQPCTFCKREELCWRWVWTVDPGRNCENAKCKYQMEGHCYYGFDEECAFSTVFEKDSLVGTKEGI